MGISFFAENANKIVITSDNPKEVKPFMESLYIAAKLYHKSMTRKIEKRGSNGF